MIFYVKSKSCILQQRRNLEQGSKGAERFPCIGLLGEAINVGSYDFLGEFIADINKVRFFCDWFLIFSISWLMSMQLCILLCAIILFIPFFYAEDINARCNVMEKIFLSKDLTNFVWSDEPHSKQKGIVKKVCVCLP